MPDYKVSWRNNKSFETYRRTRNVISWTLTSKSDLGVHWAGLIFEFCTLSRYSEPFQHCVKRTCLLMKEIWNRHEKLTDRQMDGQTDDQCLDIKLAIPTSNALPICIIFFFDLLINAGKTLLRHETVLQNVLPLNDCYNRYCILFHWLLF